MNSPDPVAPQEICAGSLAEMQFLAFDLETTGLSPAVSRIIEFGAVRFRGDGLVLGQFHQLVDPQCRIPWQAARIHGITDRMVQGQPTVAETLPRFIEFLGDSRTTLLAHNARFDVDFISVALGQLGHVAPPHAVLDTCALARRRVRLPNYQLETLGQALLRSGPARHRALEDALLVKDAFLRLLDCPPALSHPAQLWTCSPKLAFASRPVRQAPALGEWAELQSALDTGGAVVIEYAGGSQPGAARQITPRRLSRRGGQSYLIAWCHQSRCEKTFRVDRITSCRPARPAHSSNPFGPSPGGAC